MADHATFAGPGAVTFRANGKGSGLIDYYSDAGGIRLDFEREIFTPDTASWGPMGDRIIGTKTKISFVPSGHLTAALLPHYWPYSQADVGRLCKSVIGSPLIMVPNPANGSLQQTFSHACLIKAPPLKLSANSAAFGGAIEFQCWGDPAKAATHATYLTTLASAVAPSATTVDDSEFPSPRVTAQYGGATYEVDGDGVMIDYQILVGSDLRSNSGGPIELIIKGVKILASFTPIAKVASTLTEEEYVALLKLQDSSALRPGDYVGVDTNDLVIGCTGTSASISSVTLKNMGPGSGGMVWSVDAWRQGQVTFHSRPLFTTGSPQAMFSVA